ncbi:MAG: carbon monoxide dehydrogenase subunit G [Caldilineaceae bacterium]|nr:carbon monoxide dehydrogenase subunit G [Caldilineaceae bacterium]
MNIEGTYEFDAPQELVWNMLLDPVVLAKVMPNCQALEKVGEGEYEGKMKIQVGPVQGLFQGKVTLANLNPPESYRMQVQGKGPAGIVDGEGDVRLEAVEGKTIMHYAGEARVSGKIASIGQRLMDTSARAITKQSLENLEKQIEAVQNPQAAPPEAAPPVADEAPPSAPVESAASKTASEPRLPFSASAVPSGSETTSASTFQFASSIAKELFDEFVPADKQKWVLAGLGFLVIHLYLNWWANVIARRVARRIE